MFPSFEIGNLVRLNLSNELLSFGFNRCGRIVSVNYFRNKAIIALHDDTGTEGTAKMCFGDFELVYDKLN